jgi:hypothetical protein
MYLRTSEGSRQELTPADRLSNSYIGEPKLSTKAECPGYAKGEIEKSRTQQGHLPFDIIQHPRGLLIADFGVDWRHIKESTKKERLLKDWLSAAKSDLYAIFLRIYGYSDCVGNEKNNMSLRHERAKRVHAFLDKDLQSRIDFVGPARAGEYVTDNSTVEGRAKNRGVIIELSRLPGEVIEITEPPPVKTSKGLLPLVGETIDYYYVRETPNGKILGSMTGTPTPVTVEDKAYVAGKRWYQIVLNSRMKLIKDIEFWTPGKQKWNLCDFAAFWVALGKRGSVLDLPEVKRNEIELPAGTRCWVNESGVVNKADWGLFRGQLRAFEAANKNLNLNARITMLRPMGHPSDLPFDTIIGTPKGKLYFENHPFVQDQWQILRDYQKVRMPDGRTVDVYHLFVGLDVLTKKVKFQSFATIELGPNYSAATWAGDIGAGAADATISKLEKIFRDCWANLHPSATDNERLEHYYNTRAPESDLLGDIDAWGVHSLRVGQMDTIEKLLTSYYEDTYHSQRVLTTRRKDAIEWFLNQYGFKYDQARDRSKWPSALLNQQRVAIRRADFSVEYQINQFALIWMLRKIWSKVPNYKGVKPDNYFVSGMTAKFLQWLEYQAIENGAAV